MVCTKLSTSMAQQNIISKHFLKKIATELRYIEKSVFMKEVNTRNFWSFELGTQKVINVPMWNFVGIQ